MGMNVKGDLTSGDNPLTDMPNRASSKSTWSFHERYASDAEFKRQVDFARRQRMQDQSTEALSKSLNMVQNKEKLY